MSDAETCAHCGTRLYDRAVVDHYHLERVYVSLTGQQLADVVMPHTLDVYLCSATCLCAYVADNIAPDAFTE